jgi:hypothetical protein
VPWFGLLGTIVTWAFLPDTTGLDLREQERRWKFIREGREHEYHGPAVHRKHLSVWERWTGKGKYYDAALDYDDKVREYRAEWEAAMSARADEKNLYDMDDVDDHILSGSMHTYFERTTPDFRGIEKEVHTEELMALPASAADQEKPLNH